MIYKRFNLRNAAKWRKPKRMRCTPLQTPGEMTLQSICCRRTLPGRAAARVPAGSAPAHRGSEQPRGTTVTLRLGAARCQLGARTWVWAGRGHWRRVHGKPTPQEFFLGGGEHPILSKTCFPFLLSALLPPLLLPARSSRSAPVILSSLPSVLQRRSISPRHPVKPSSVV